MVGRQKESASGDCWKSFRDSPSSGERSDTRFPNLNGQRHEGLLRHHAHKLVSTFPAPSPPRSMWPSSHASCGGEGAEARETPCENPSRRCPSGVASDLLGNSQASMRSERSDPVRVEEARMSSKPRVGSFVANPGRRGATPLGSRGLAVCLLVQWNPHPPTPSDEPA